MLLKKINIKDRIFITVMSLVAIIAIIFSTIKVNAASFYTKPAELKSNGIVAYDGDKDGGINGSNDIYIAAEDLYYLYDLAK